MYTTYIVGSVRGVVSHVPTVLDKHQQSDSNISRLSQSSCHPMMPRNQSFATPISLHRNCHLCPLKRSRLHVTYTRPVPNSRVGTVLNSPLQIHMGPGGTQRPIDGGRHGPPAGDVQHETGKRVGRGVWLASSVFLFQWLDSCQELDLTSPALAAVALPGSPCLPRLLVDCQQLFPLEPQRPNPGPAQCQPSGPNPQTPEGRSN